MDEAVVEVASPGDEEVTLYVKIPLDVADWLNRVSKLGLTKKLVINTALRTLMRTPLEESVFDIIKLKAKQLGLIETSKDESPASEGGESE